MGPRMRLEILTAVMTKTQVSGMCHCVIWYIYCSEMSSNTRPLTQHYIVEVSSNYLL